MFKTIKTLIAVAALSGTVGANVQAKEVTVHKGDTIWELSKVHNAPVENIKKWNDLATDVIHPGDILNIAAMKHYVVKPSDTLWSIADENNIKVLDLIDWNELYTNLIHPGLNLVIFDDSVPPGQMAPIKQADANSTDLQANSGAAAVITAGDQPDEKLNSPAPESQVTQQAAEVKPVNDQPDASASASAPVQAPAAAQTAQAPAPNADPAPETAPPQAPEQAPAPAAVQSDAPKEITVKATAYTASCEGCSGITKTGVNLKENPGEKVIAVDPSVIPLGSKVYIEGYGEATAADTGGAIKGNRIDVYMQNESDALQFGAKELTVKILN